MKTILYVLLYLMFLVPTYALPYAGSNAYMTVLSGLEAVRESGPLPDEAAEMFGVAAGAFLAHLSCLLALFLLVLALVPGKWIAVLPVTAATFDMVPFLNWIPLVPTAMHLLALVLGAKGISEAKEKRRREAA